MRWRLHYDSVFGKTVSYGDFRSLWRALSFGFDRLGRTSWWFPWPVWEHPMADKNLLKDDSVLIKMGKYQAGDMTGEEIKEFFQDLIDSYPEGQLPGEFRRTAKTLIAFGACKPRSKQHGTEVDPG